MIKHLYFNTVNSSGKQRFQKNKKTKKRVRIFVQVKHAFFENNLLFKSAMHSSLGASIAYSHSEKGVGKPHEFTSSQNAVCSNMFFPLVGRLRSRGFYVRFD